MLLLLHLLLLLLLGDKRLIIAVTIVDPRERVLQFFLNIILEYFPEISQQQVEQIIRHHQLMLILYFLQRILQSLIMHIFQQNRQSRVPLLLLNYILLL